VALYPIDFRSLAENVAKKILTNPFSCRIEQAKFTFFRKKNRWKIDRMAPEGVYFWAWSL